MKNLITKIEEVHKDKKVIVFDLDGTLAESKMLVDAEMSGLLTELLKQRTVAVIGGQNFDGFKTHLLNQLPIGAARDNLFILPLNGASFYQHQGGQWRQDYSKELLAEEKEHIKDALEEVFKETGYVGPEYLYGEQVEDRGSQVTFSALGQEAPLEEKIKWSQEHHTEMIILAEKLQGKLPEMEVKIAGLTSMDVTPKGINKKFGLEQLANRLAIQTNEMLFVGDAFEPDGNDTPALASGALCFKVDSPADTKELLKYLLD
ncbi:MAG: hypothetical protein A3I39_01575 [Candidatus Yanofskybacteria bacterium RIFCSPLOWO2_02_FULL_47_9b]|uniref:phosphomannomutase n=1 Tax=Candidatus Yanofskybacteria bacterium RIFCSPLOWO2_02_FULL_47_9b TaxID=1802708 RepID=A0A1F8HBK0_9BACT|nr:MAG: hypothetical protein A3I39_01575 [Candidatus Yanofskybacteria bacterium RIFCSPLOWO2_02_FULL_47_9b]